MNDIEKREKSDMKSIKKMRTTIDQVNRIFAMTSIILLVFVIVSTLAPNRVTLPIPPIFLWYGLAFSFLVWFSTRKGGCGSCNQAKCSI